MAYAKANGDKLNNAHAGLSSVAYAACLQFNGMLGHQADADSVSGRGPVSRRRCSLARSTMSAIRCSTARRM